MGWYGGGVKTNKEHRKKVTSNEVINIAKGHSYFLTVDKKDEYDARAAVNSIKGTIKYQGWDEGTWTRYRFYFYSSLDADTIKKAIKGRIRNAFSLNKVS